MENTIEVLAGRSELTARGAAKILRAALLQIHPEASEAQERCPMSADVQKEECSACVALRETRRFA